MRLFGVVGWKDTGKTGLVVRLVEELARRGLSVSTVKHAHHAFDVDRPGKDSHRHRAAGARQVLLSSASRWALMTELAGADEPGLDGLLARLDPVDLVLVEGYKGGAHPKIETHRAAVDRPLVANGDSSVLAVASDASPDTDLPVFDLDATGEIADFVLANARRVEP